MSREARRLSRDLPSGIVLLGPPGAGKGTQAALLAARLGLKHISTGEILREEVQQGTELGKKARAYMDRGELVPDELMIEMLDSRLDGRFLLDGFPRTTNQAEALERIAKVERVLSIRLSEEETVRRLTARRVCADCGRNYNLVSNPPRVPGVCDACGGRLIQRDDDTPEVIRRRYRVYEAQTAPLREFYRQRGLLVEVEGGRAIEEVFQEALRLLEEGR
ncbi:MAG: adenylate kinase [Candidatus Acetothermia bacterium]|jgi:adenylate kinase|nr:adenylate kinase [Candidatus Acetothermia bacterium]MDH7505533.1 adenylate kinase [Candidatus Acetothermia bacterium]